MASIGDVAKLLASLELDTSKFSGPAKGAIGQVDALESKLGKTGAAGVRSMGLVGHAVSTALGIGLARAASAGIGLLTSAFRDGVAGAQELEKVGVATDQVLRSTGGAAGQTADDIRNLATKYEDLNATIDDKVIQSGENLLLTFTRIRKDAFQPALAAALDMNQAMGGGESGLQNTIIQVGKALNDPIKGLTSLRRVGVSFTADQEKQIKSLVKHNKLREAQKIILHELSKEFGGQFVQAGKTAEAQAASLSDSVDDLKITFATGLLPGLANLRSALTTTFRDPQTIAAVKDLGTRLGDFLSPANIQAGIGLVRSGFGALKQVPWGAIKSAMELTGNTARTVLGLLNSAPDWVKTAVLTGWGLNKLTGGVAGNIFGELAKGLIKGVLGINAGVVNVNGAVVNSKGGLPGGPAGAGGAAGGAAAGAEGGGAAAGFLAPGLGALVAGIAAPLIMFDVIPYLARKENISQGTQRGMQTRAGAFSPQMVQQWSGMINGFEQKVTNAGGKALGTTGGKDTAKSLDGLRSENRIHADHQQNSLVKVAQRQADTYTALQDQKAQDAQTAAAQAAKVASLQSATTSGLSQAQSGISSATTSGANLVASAVRQSRPIVNTDVKVYVTPAHVTTATSTSERYGSQTGSAGGGSNGSARPPTTSGGK